MAFDPSTSRRAGRGRAAPAVGVELSGTHVRAAVDGAVVREVALPPGAVVAGDIVDVAALARALRRLLAGAPARGVRAGLGSPRTTTRTVVLPGTPEGAALAAAVAAQVRELLPVALDEVVLGHTVLSAGPETSRVLVVAAPADQVRALAAALGEARVRDFRVDAAGPALAGVAPPGVRLVVDAGRLTTLCVSEQGACAFARTARAGLEHLVAGLAEAQGMEEPTALQLVRGALGTAPVPEGATATLDLVRVALGELGGQVVAEARSSLDFYRRSDGASPVEGIVLCGEAAAWAPLAAMLQDELGLPVEVAGSAAGSVAAALSGGPVVELTPPEAVRPARSPVAGAWTRRAVVGAAAVLACAAVGTAAAGNRVEDRRAQLRAAERDLAELQHREAALAPVAAVARRRSALEADVRRVLARRFPWDEVLAGVSGAAAGTVELTRLRGAVEPGVAGGGGGLRAAHPGPAVELAGCAASVEDVSRFLRRLGELPGVADVALDSTRRERAARACDAPQAFSVVAFYDGVVPPLAAAAAASTVAAPSPTPEPETRR